MATNSRRIKYIVPPTIGSENIKAGMNHSGSVTHHHDQVATAPIPVNFRTKRIKNAMLGRDISLGVSGMLSFGYFRSVLFIFFFLFWWVDFFTYFACAKMPPVNG